MIWIHACETDFKIHQILIYFKKKVPKTDIFRIFGFPLNIFSTLLSISSFLKAIGR